MSRIRLLPEAVASQVAAGEVVERPASVIKELVENSLDAQAGRIEVSVRRGGISLIRVVDDGVGMDRDDALMSLERHATSKIRSGEDLASVATLGFRGEALPSIASVSRFRLATRPKEDLAGTEILVNGGRIDSVKESGEAPGTFIEVRSLFYNLPARRKFLRTEPTEAAHVEHQLHLLAIAHPAVSFTFYKDERRVFQLAPAPDLATRIRDLFGSQLFSELLPVPPDTQVGGVRVSGFLGRPGVSRSNRSQQLVFVNGRAVENAALQSGLREGYHTALMKGRYPITFLFVELPFQAVDVNVHPAKREVRFHQPSVIREAMTRAVASALEEGRQSWAESISVPPPSSPEAIPPPAAPITAPTQEPASSTAPVPAAAATPAMPAASPARPAVVDKTDTPPTEPTLPEFSDPAPAIATRSAEPSDIQSPFRILGLLGKLYLLMESNDGLVLLDQHAAHERILFEQMLRQQESGGVAGQRLLFPALIELGPRESNWLRRRGEDLKRLGVGLEDFGERTFKIDSLPALARVGDPRQFVRDLLDELMSVGSGTSPARLGEDTIAKTVCRHAVKAHDDLRPEEAGRLLSDLLQCDLPYCCPHGRPTMVRINYSELEKRFGRRT